MIAHEADCAVIAGRRGRLLIRTVASSLRLGACWDRLGCEDALMRCELGLLSSTSSFTYTHCARMAICRDHIGQCRLHEASGTFMPRALSCAMKSWPPTRRRLA